MKINVLFFGPLRDLTGQRERDVVLSEKATLKELLTTLKDTYGDAFESKIEGMRILVNGREYTFTGGYETPLREGDTVVFLPPLFGG